MVSAQVNRTPMRDEKQSPSPGWIHLGIANSLRLLRSFSFGTHITKTATTSIGLKIRGFRTHNSQCDFESV